MWSLADKELLQAENTMIRWRDGRSYNGRLLYTVKPIEQILKERGHGYAREGSQLQHIHTSGQCR